MSNIKCPDVDIPEEIHYLCSLIKIDYYSFIDIVVYPK